MKEKIIVFFLCLMFLYTTTSCEQYGKIRTSINREEEIIFGYGPWKSAKIQTELVKHQIEIDIERKVITQEYTNNKDLWTALGNHEVDAIVCGWFPDIHESYYQKVKNQVEDLGVNYKGARYGLAVPEYVNIADVQELKLYGKKFYKQIHALDQESSLMDYVKNINKTYRLDYQIIPHTEASLMAGLEEAIQNKRWIVVTGWTPHWMVEKYHLRFLEDTEKVYGKTFNIHTIVSKQLKKKNANVYEGLKNFKIKPGELEKMMLIVNEKENKAVNEVITDWVKNMEYQ